MTTFCTNTQFLVRYDGRWVAKNVLDDGSAPSIASLQDSSSAGGSVLAALILEASEMVMAECAVGARYSVDDLTTYGGTLLIRIVSDLTMGLILKRRGRAVTDEADLSKPFDEALNYLEQLRRGERIFFAVPNVPEAGLPTTATMIPTPGSCPGLWTNQASRFFGACGCEPGCGTSSGGC